MPIYEYHCNSCGNQFEKMQKMDAPMEAACTCGASAERILSLTSFSLKGKGWASDNYGAPAPSSCASGSSCPTGTCPLASGS